MNCIVLVAGYATRLYPLTENFPKPLLDVGGKTIADWLIDDLDQSANGSDAPSSRPKIERFVVISNARYAARFREWRDAKKEGASGLIPSRAPIEILDDGSTTNETRLGAVKDVLFALETLDMSGDVAIVAGDNVLNFSLGSFLDYFAGKSGGTIMRYFEPNEERLRKCGVLELGEGDRVLSMVEKPKEPRSHWCVPPFYAYRDLSAAKLRDALEHGCGFDAPGSLAAWLALREPIFAMEMPGKRFDVGSLDSYNKIKAEYAGIDVDRR